MGIGPEEAGRLDLWTYEALLWNWNRAHDPEGSRDPDEPITDLTKLRRFHRAHALH